MASNNNSMLIDLRSSPYNEFIMHGGGALSQNNRDIGGGYYLDKEVADAYVNYAKSRNVVFVYNSAYREANIPVTGHGGAQITSGSSHSTAASLDIQTVLTRKEVSGATDLKSLIVAKSIESEKNSRVASVVADIIKSDDTALQAGAQVYPNERRAPMDIIIDGETITVNKAELMHIQHKGVLDPEHRLYKDSKENQERTANAVANLTSAQKAAQGSNTQLPNVYDLNSKKAAILEGNTLTQAKQLPDKPITLADMKNVGVVYNSGSAPTNANVKSGGYVNLVRTPTALPRDLSSGSISRAISVDPAQLNNLRNVSESDYKISAAIPKNIRNAYENKSPFGEQFKHSGPAAAIKLVPDKLFESQLTPLAKKAWEDIKKINYIDNFIVERMTKIDEERYSLTQSISDEYKAYFSGKRPTIMSVSGKLLNTYNQQWWYDFEFFYDNYLRGSKAVEYHIRAFLTIADAVFEIIVLKLAVDAQSSFDSVVSYSMDYILLQKLYTGDYKSPITRASNAHHEAYLKYSSAQSDLSPDMISFISAYSSAYAGDNAGQAYVSALSNAGKPQSREDLQDSYYASLQKKLLLAKSNIDEIDELKLKYLLENRSIITPGSVYSSSGSGDNTSAYLAGFDARLAYTPFESENLAQTAPKLLMAQADVGDNMRINLNSDKLALESGKAVVSANAIPASFEPYIPNSLRSLRWELVQKDAVAGSSNSGNNVGSYEIVLASADTQMQPMRMQLSAQPQKPTLALKAIESSNSSSNNSLSYQEYNKAQKFEEAIKANKIAAPLGHVSQAPDEILPELVQPHVVKITIGNATSHEQKMNKSQQLTKQREAELLRGFSAVIVNAANTANSQKGKS